MLTILDVAAPGGVVGEDGIRHRKASGAQIEGSSLVGGVASLEHRPGHEDVTGPDLHRKRSWGVRDHWRYKPL